MHQHLRIRDAFLVLLTGLLFLLALPLLSSTPVSSAGIGECQVGNSHSSIQEALDAPECTSIVVPAGLYTEHLTVTRDVTMTGAGPATTIVDGSGNGRVMSVAGATGRAQISIRGMTFRNGAAEIGAGVTVQNSVITLTNVHIRNNRATIAGGLLNYGSGAVSLVEVEISGNRSQVAAGVYNAGTMQVQGGEIYDNIATTVGGVANVAAMAMEGTIVHSNVVTEVAGGILNQSMLGFVASDITVRDNEAAYGGGLMLMGPVTLTESTISANRAFTDGAGLFYLSEAGYTMSLDNTIVARNEAGASGGGVVISPTIPAFDRAPLREADVLPGCTMDERAGRLPLLPSPHCLPSRRGEGTSATPDLLLRDSDLRRNSAADSGGALFQYRGATSIVSSRIYSNSAAFGGGVVVYPYAIGSNRMTFSDTHIFGNNAQVIGGLFVSGQAHFEQGTIHHNHASLSGGVTVESNGAMTLHESRIHDNVATGSIIPYTEGIGGGILSSGVVTLSDSTVEGNVAAGGGGGLAIPFGRMTITGSTISRNEGQSGGGILNGSAVLSLTNSTISHNEAYTSGGGLHVSNPVTVTARSVTIAANEAGRAGGGILITESLRSLLENVDLERWPLLASMVRNDEPSLRRGRGALTLQNTLVGDNNARTGPDCYGHVLSGGYNLVERVSECVIHGDTTGTVTGDPRLGPLQDNGGPTETHALEAESPALDAGAVGECPPVDQRGVPRPVDGDGEGNERCDIGAYEFEPVIPAISITNASRLEGDRGLNPITFTVRLSAATNLNVTVKYRSANQTAVSGRDYLATSGTLLFTPGITEQVIPVMIIGDTEVEGNETFTINLSEPVNATLSDTHALGTILNDDEPPPGRILYLPLLVN